MGAPHCGEWGVSRSVRGATAERGSGFSVRPWAAQAARDVANRTRRASFHQRTSVEGGDGRTTPQRARSHANPVLARLPRSVGTGGQADLPADAWRGNAEKKRRTRRDQARRPGGRWRSPWWRMRCGSTHKASHPDHRALVARMAAWRRPRSHATAVGKGGERPSSHASSPVLTPARRPMWPATQADIWVSLANGMAALGG